MSASRLRVRYGSLPVLDIGDLHVCPDAGGGSWGWPHSLTTHAAIFDEPT
ncbi:hypothetical protein HMPREF9582_01701 [Cutibacterium acnes HL060PA1]|nr:hypothetical protein HMPREF9582_01701 [Cutibacterium acnes HL060PA1]